MIKARALLILSSLRRFSVIGVESIAVEQEIL